LIREVGHAYQHPLGNESSYHLHLDAEMPMIDLIKFILTFIVFCVIAVVSATNYKQIITKTLICPEPERLLQVMSDGNEVMCVYTKIPQQNKPHQYLKGIIQ